MLRLFHVAHVTQNKRYVLSLTWHERFSCKSKDEEFTAESSQISRRLLVDYVKKMLQKACGTCSTNVCPHSTNHIIDLWRCRCPCRQTWNNRKTLNLTQSSILRRPFRCSSRRSFLNSLIQKASNNNGKLQDDN